MRMRTSSRGRFIPRHPLAVVAAAAMVMLAVGCSDQPTVTGVATRAPRVEAATVGSTSRAQTTRVEYPIQSTGNQRNPCNGEKVHYSVVGKESATLVSQGSTGGEEEVTIEEHGHGVGESTGAKYALGAKETQNLHAQNSTVNLNLEVHFAGQGNAPDFFTQQVYSYNTSTGKLVFRRNVYNVCRGAGA